MNRNQSAMYEDEVRPRKGKWTREERRLKSERVQLELQRADGVRKLIQRGDGGRFVPAVVVPAGPSGVRVAVLVEVPACAVARELLVTATLAPAEGGPAGEAEIGVGEAFDAAA
jgi:hypothetical protein